MRDLKEIMQDKRLEINGPENGLIPLAVRGGEFAGSGWARLNPNSKSAKWASVVFGSDEDGLEHVSVAFKDRLPTWDEMCVVKDIFWKDEEQCVQLHPRKSEYVDIHPNCLHIWRKKDADESWPY